MEEEKVQPEPPKQEENSPMKQALERLKALLDEEKQIDEGNAPTPEGQLPDIETLTLEELIDKYGNFTPDDPYPSTDLSQLDIIEGDPVVVATIAKTFRNICNDVNIFKKMVAEKSPLLYKGVDWDAGVRFLDPECKNNVKTLRGNRHVVIMDVFVLLKNGNLQPFCLPVFF